jgi:glucose-1-phosphate adenylyltransferase
VVGYSHRVGFKADPVHNGTLTSGVPTAWRAASRTDCGHRVFQSPKGAELVLRDVLAIVLAGGRGTRLEPLTRDRAKPAVPFGGIYRIIDFTLSNCINSDLRRMLVLTQYKAVSLARHIDQGWKFLCRELDEYIEVIPPQQRIAENWYQGTADAIYQNVYTIEKANPRETMILAGDHIYKMNYATMVDFHRSRGADLTIACLPVSKSEARNFGIMEVDADGRVTRFVEKPKLPTGAIDPDERVLASMGIYVFNTNVMYELLFQDALRRDTSGHDFGRDIIPNMLKNSSVYAYPFRDENRKTAAYWRDVGTLDAYYQTSMDLIAVDPILNLYDRVWPIHTYQPPFPPPKFVHDAPGRMGSATNSIVCQGTIVSGGEVKRSILSPAVRINSYANVEDSILFEGVNISRHAMVRRAIIDKDVHVPPGMKIGFDTETDLRRGFTVTEGGVTIVPKGEDLARYAES